MVASAPVLFERKQVFALDLPFAQQIRLINHRFEPRWRHAEQEVTILTGLHGDELDGGYICHRLSQFLQRLPVGWRLEGAVNLLPSANPLAGSLGERFVPEAGSDLNRIFPGDPDGSEWERLAAAIFAIAGRSTACFDIHSSNSFLEELPQVRVVHEPRLIEWANCLGLDVVWSHSQHNWIAGTVAQALFERGVPALVIELGTGRRIHRGHCERVFQGILQWMLAVGVLSGGPVVAAPNRPLQASEFNIVYINAETGGLFLPRPSLNLGERLKRGSRVGQVIDPLSGQEAEVIAPIDGHLFTLRVHPLVYAGSLVARLVHL
ncbi:M14 family metallopeptidase [Gloeobacter morelensis]|uniref:Succinylglutamate desuccinylase/aspartoacylase family protein n=1 Tax=Gloeobacter morelensis MG652769 TaxID=2781736 RepID=A0ABY3PRG7_9CYAN|nr:M14 family metallopeptidase [Gloeobacter morelensis]UFP96293.1 succinylglutamate desuccinylase/aspartoacylase family protein [Gloeobacter morelensis MG652769]